MFVALNVGCNKDGTTYITNTEKQGSHWSLLVIDINNVTSYYCDSLGWPVPINIKGTVGCNLAIIEGDSGMSINNCLSSIRVVRPHSNHTCTAICKGYYPWQSCSNMCGVIVMCMAAIISHHWDFWTSWDCNSILPLLSYPSKYHKELRLIVIFWLINEHIDTRIFLDSKEQPLPSIQKRINTIIDSDDDFEPPCKKAKLQPKVGDEVDIPAYETAVSEMLPDNYLYNTFEVSTFTNKDIFHCKFRIMIDSEEKARKWLQHYNEKSKETMVYERSKKREGKRVVKKLFLRCQHKQRQTGQHTKSVCSLKTTHKQHNSKHTSCPAQMTLTILVPLPEHKGYSVEVNLKHTHNHLIIIADALRFRPISEKTKDTYYELFKQGHSASSAHLEYETNLMYTDPHVLADRHENPKVSDVFYLFNKWRKSNLGVRAGKELFTALEERVIAYNESNK